MSLPMHRTSSPTARRRHKDYTPRYTCMLRHFLRYIPILLMPTVCPSQQPPSPTYVHKRIPGRILLSQQKKRHKNLGPLETPHPNLPIERAHAHPHGQAKGPYRGCSFSHGRFEASGLDQNRLSKIGSGTEGMGFVMRCWRAGWKQSRLRR